MKKILTTLFIFFMPSVILKPILKLLGHKIGKKVKIGFSIITSKEIIIEDNCKIGHFNLVLNNSIQLHSNTIIGYLNILKGPFNLVLKEKAALGNKNYITRAKKGITYNNSILQLGILTKVTVGHHLDLTKSITFGDYSILAGIKSQLWTHGYYHADTGINRIRIDGEIIIGNNVYIGSGCIFNPGVNITDAIHIGSGCVISKNLDKKGMYVSQELRFIENNIENIKKKLNKVINHNLIEKVYIKK